MNPVHAKVREIVGAPDWVPVTFNGAPEVFRPGEMHISPGRVEGIVFVNSVLNLLSYWRYENGESTLVEGDYEDGQEIYIRFFWSPETQEGMITVGRAVPYYVKE